jgi:hypothetical protein
LPDDARRISGHYREWGDIFCDDAAGCDNGMFADRYTCRDDGISAYPAIVPDPDKRRGTILKLDGRMDIRIAVVHGQDTYVLGEDDVIADFDRADDYVAHSDERVVADNDIAHAVVDNREIFDDGVIADDEFPKGEDVQSGASADDGSFSSFMDKGVDKESYPPAWFGLTRGHQHIEKEILHPLVGSYFLDIAQFETKLPMAE